MGPPPPGDKRPRWERIATALWECDGGFRGPLSKASKTTQERMHQLAIAALDACGLQIECENQRRTDMDNYNTYPTQDQVNGYTDRVPECEVPPAELSILGEINDSLAVAEADVQRFLSRFYDQPAATLPVTGDCGSRVCYSQDLERLRSRAAALRVVIDGLRRVG